MNNTSAISMARQAGVTLVELMVTLAIVSILAAIAYPSYGGYVVKSNRSAVETFLFSVANKEEQYLLDARQYAGTLETLGMATLPSTVSGNYTVSVTVDNSATPPSYTIKATPIGSQAIRDTTCAELTLKHDVTKGQTGTGSSRDCW